MIPLLFANDEFPSPETADSQGLLAYSKNLSIERTIEAYHAGIFPWYETDQPVLWWSPDPRMVLFPQKLHLSKSMRRLLRQEKFRVTYNQDFTGVMRTCAKISRRRQHGTWITPEMVHVYTQLHRRGIAHSVEVWKDNTLVGGLYGVHLIEKRIFCGESMFSTVSNASKYGFIVFVNKLKKEGIKLIDCQVYSAHLESLGAEEIPRKRFLEYLKPF